MKIHILVEGPSERAFLEPWIRRLRLECAVRIHPHEGKGALPDDPTLPPDPANRSLLHQLPAKLRAFEGALSAEESVVVLVDADDDDCVALTAALDSIAREYAPTSRVLVRIAIEEIEAFYLGDLKALEKAFPHADMELARSHIPDSICGTWELFGRVIDDDGARKTDWAHSMGSVMTTTPARNRSPSFGALCRALKRLATPTRVTPAQKEKRFRHRARTDKTRRFRR